MHSIIYILDLNFGYNISVLPCNGCAHISYGILPMLFTLIHIIDHLFDIEVIQPGLFLLHSYTGYWSLYYTLLMVIVQYSAHGVFIGPIYMLLFIYIYMCIYMYICMYVLLHMYMYVYAHVYMYVCIYNCRCLWVCVYCMNIFCCLRFLDSHSISHIWIIVWMHSYLRND